MHPLDSLGDTVSRPTSSSLSVSSSSPLLDSSPCVDDDSDGDYLPALVDIGEDGSDDEEAAWYMPPSPPPSPPLASPPASPSRGCSLFSLVSDGIHQVEESMETSTSLTGTPAQTHTQSASYDESTSVLPIYDAVIGIQESTSRVTHLATELEDELHAALQSSLKQSRDRQPSLVPASLGLDSESCAALQHLSPLDAVNELEFSNSSGVTTVRLPPSASKVDLPAPPVLAAALRSELSLSSPLAVAPNSSPEPLGVLESSPSAALAILIQRWQHLVVHVRYSFFEVYIGRPRSAQGETAESAPWGCPFVCADNSCSSERESCLTRYRRHLFMNPDIIFRARQELAGKILGCWCTPRSCHGDLLAALANCTAAELRHVLPVSLTTEQQQARDRELASFSFPLTSVAEVQRLLATRHASPTVLLGGEFSGAVRDELLLVYNVLALAVDIREPLSPGISFIGDMVDVMHLKVWTAALFWPPCVHQTISDTTSQSDKLRDGRAFWGMALCIRCLCTLAYCVMVEQPDVIIPRFYPWYPQRLRPSFFGDKSRKPINLFWVGTDWLAPPLDIVGVADSGSFFSFADADERDRHRSSWLRHVCLTAAVAWGASPARGRRPLLSYRVEIERLAIEFHRRGLPVPKDYANPTGRPLDSSSKAYQFVRGPGDARRIASMIPLTLYDELPDHFQLSVSRTSLSPLLEIAVPLAHFAGLSHQAVVLCLVALATQPLVYAPLDGFTVIGAELSHTLHRDSALLAATSWISANAIATRAACFLAGEFLDGPRVAVAPVCDNIAEDEVVRSANDRKYRRKRGQLFGWCTLAVLAALPAAEPAQRAVAAASAFVAPVWHLADSASLGSRPFRFGVLAATPLDDSVSWSAGLLPNGYSLIKLALQQGWMLRDALLQRSSPDDILWAERVSPFSLEDIPPQLLQDSGNFDDDRLADTPFVSIPAPLRTAWLPRSPPQPESSRCPLTAWELMLPGTQRRVRRWLLTALDDLHVISEEGPLAERFRPRPIAIGQDELFPWARGIIWDFTFERSACGVPLDYDTPIETQLNLTFLYHRLSDYPDQRLLSNLMEGVRLEADVELQAVLNPHLTSLPNGFAAVRKELRRMNAKGWYKFFGHFPFFPVYLNGQGTTPRKYEPGRDRRTTDGGAPRKYTVDLAGLLAWSINDASKRYHWPRHFDRFLHSSDTRVLNWLRVKSLPRTAEQLLTDVFLRSKWPKEAKPTLQ